MSLITKEQMLEWWDSGNCKSWIPIMETIDVFLFIKKGIPNISPIYHFLIKVFLECENPKTIKFSDLKALCKHDIDDWAWLHLTSLKKNNQDLENIWSELVANVHKAISEGLFTIRDIQLKEIWGVGRFKTQETPECINKLVNSILEIQPSENVAEIGCGLGSSLIEFWKNQDQANYFGYEINTNFFMESAVRTEFLKGKFEIVPIDAFFLAENSDNEKYDKIFSNYPFKVRLSDLDCGQDFFKDLCKKIPAISKATTSDWIYNALMCDLIKENGKAIGIMTNGSTWNTTDKAIRQYFIENGLIEAIISLPPRMFCPATVLPTSMIILSKNNESVKIVNATSFCKSERRENVLSDKNIEDIISALKTDGKNSITVSKELLRNNDYNLNFDRYIANSKSFENPTPFESVIKKITRGAGIKADELDRITTSEITNKNYLMLGNIHEGIIDDELPYLTEIDKSLEKYCLKKNNLILSKNGYPFKVAIATPKEEQQILANGNLYIVELDEEKVNPYYIKAFFESEQGIASLKSIVVGTSIPNIGVENLKHLLIPVPPMEYQNKIAEEYLAAQDEIKILKMRLAKAVDRLYHIIDEGENS